MPFCPKRPLGAVVRETDLAVEQEAGTVTGAGSAIRYNSGGRNIPAPIAQVVAALAAGNALFKISQDDARY